MLYGKTFGVFYNFCCPKCPDACSQFQVGTYNPQLTFHILPNENNQLPHKMS